MGRAAHVHAGNLLPRSGRGSGRSQALTQGCGAFQHNGGKPQGIHMVIARRSVAAFGNSLYDEAQKDGWTVISMKNDWKRIFPFK